MSTTYYPQTDGQSEDLNKCIEQYMRCFVSESPHEWVPMLPWAEFRYNTTFYSFAEVTPLQALYGREPPTISRYVSGSAGDDLIEKYMLKRDDVLVLLKNNLSKAQTCMKLYVDARRTDLQLEVGDWAFVKLKPYRQLSLRLHHHHKLRRKYFGPYQVLKRIGYVAYKLDLPADAQIHLVFHISMLKKCVGTPVK
uniref:Putative ovule protein n=1 Tax=Solanum chacoense TaxID=4108 RepID=A0A0V0IKE6_SOLCH